MVTSHLQINATREHLWKEILVCLFSFIICFALTLLELFQAETVWHGEQFSNLKLYFSCPITTMHFLARDHYPYLLCTLKVLLIIYLKLIVNISMHIHQVANIYAANNENDYYPQKYLPKTLVYIQIYHRPFATKKNGLIQPRLALVHVQPDKLCL